MLDFPATFTCAHRGSVTGGGPPYPHSQRPPLAPCREVGTVTNAPSAVVHLIMSLRSSHLIGDHLFDFGATAVACSCSLCQERVFTSCPDFWSAPRAHADGEHSRYHIEHLLFECPGILCTGGTLPVTLLRDDLFKACFGSDHASAVLLAACPSNRTPVVSAGWRHGLSRPAPPRP